VKILPLPRIIAEVEDQGFKCGRQKGMFVEAAVRKRTVAWGDAARRGQLRVRPPPRGHRRQHFADAPLPAGHGEPGAHERPRNGDPARRKARRQDLDVAR